MVLTRFVRSKLESLSVQENANWVAFRRGEDSSIVDTLCEQDGEEFQSYLLTTLFATGRRDDWLRAIDGAEALPHD